MQGNESSEKTKLLPRKEFTNDEIANTEYLAKPIPITNNASCQVSWCLCFYMYNDVLLYFQEERVGYYKGIGTIAVSPFHFLPA